MAVDARVDRDLGVRGAVVAADAVAASVEELEIAGLDEFGAERPRHDEPVWILGMADAHVPEGVEHSLVREDAVREDEVPEQRLGGEGHRNATVRAEELLRGSAPTVISCRLGAREGGPRMERPWSILGA